MESQLSPDARHQLNIFCRQVLQVCLESELVYPDDTHLRNDIFQQYIYANLFRDDMVKYAPPQRYQLKILKELTKRIEESIVDWEEEGVSDDLMTRLSSLISTPVLSEATSVQQKSYVTYTISSIPAQSHLEPTITLLEARNLLATSGVVGLRTWEAALYFGNYLSHNRHLIERKSILELGAGTGYISILCSKFLGASHVLATDGPDDVVAGLATNFYLNSLQDSAKISPSQLKWGYALAGGEHSQWNAGRKIDLVLGADLTYDASWFPALLSTFADIFELYPDVKIIIAATVRNPETFDKFLKMCEMGGLRFEIVDFEVSKQEGPFFSTKAPFKICVISSGYS